MSRPYMKFDIAKLEKLNDPGRFETIVPEVMWAALGEPSPETIVEIGAGTGLFAAAFAAKAPSAEIYAIDIEPKMVEWMRANRPEVASGRIVPVLAEETRVPLDDGIADIVVMINLHHELAEPEATCAEAYRLLKSGGMILVADWADRDTPKGPPREIRASAEELLAALEGAGFVDACSHDKLVWHELVTAVKP